jgi:hypothetical protein
MAIVCLFARLAIAADGPQQTSAPTFVAGQRVEVKGTLKSGSSMAARRIRLRDADRGSKIEGVVHSIDTPRRQLTISSFTVAFAADVSIQRDDTTPASLADLRTGDIVEAKGLWSGGQLTASRLRLRGTPPPGDPAANEVEIEADIESADAESGEFGVLGYRVALGPGGKIADERTQSESTKVASEDPGPDRLRRDVDDQQVPPIRIGEWLTLGGRVAGDLWDQRHLVDDADTRDHEEHANALAQLLASVRLGRYVELYTKVGASRAFVLRGTAAPAGEQSDVRLYEAYIALGLHSPVGLQVGRQRFRDGREWFFDDYLDAVRMHLAAGTWRFEAAMVDGVFAGRRELRSRNEQRHTIASLTKRFGERTNASAFFIARDDRPRRERPTWIGGEWNGRATSDLKYWVVGAGRRGQAESGRLRGWALDAGMAGRLPWRGAPSFTGGYATATGDASGLDGVDTRFRQTGLDDNRARFFGVKRFAQYGEVLDPELSNLSVLTVGVGARPLSRTSIDLVYHQYTQRELRRSLSSNRLEATGTGRSTRLGEELDLIVAVQQLRRIDLSLVVGVFRPGVGMSSPSRPVMYWKPEIRLFF